MSRVLNILLKITQTPHVKTFVELERGDVFLENFSPFVVVGVSDRYVIYSRYDKPFVHPDRLSIPRRHFDRVIVLKNIGL